MFTAELTAAAVVLFVRSSCSYPETGAGLWQRGAGDGDDVGRRESLKENLRPLSSACVHQMIGMRGKA